VSVIAAVVVVTGFALAGPSQSSEPQTACAALGDPHAYAVGLGTSIGTVGGGVVGGVTGAALLAYGIDAALNGSSGPDALHTTALVASPFVVAGAVVAGAASGAAIGANIVDGELVLASVIGGLGGFGAASVAAVIIIGAGLQQQYPEPLRWGFIVGGSAAAVVAAGVGAQVVYEAFRHEPAEDEVRKADAR
jgi:hypothetical protein